jgi:hypothetical protein
VTSSPPPPGPSTYAPRENPDERASDDGPSVFRIGVLVGTGLPSLLSIGGTIKLTRFIGAGATFGLIPSVRLSYYGEAVLAYQHYDFYGRLYPFGGSFFLGAGVGYVTVNGSLDQTVDVSSYSQQDPRIPPSVSYSSQGSVKTLVLSPTLGFLHSFDSGFSVGLDFGVVLPIAPSEIEFDSQVSAGDLPDAVKDQYLAPVDAQVVDTLETIGRTPLPSVNLRIGWIL